MPQYLRQPLFLVGFAGSGKTTIGERLARRLNVPFIDTDRQIELHTGLKVRDIFAQNGEKHFRALETGALHDVFSKPRTGMVIALGGGALISSENRKLIASAGPVVYLRCNQQELYRRLKTVTDRPLLAAGPDTGKALKAKIRTLLNRRMTGYRTADFTVSTAGRTPGEVVTRIVEIVRKLHVTYQS